MATVVTTYTPQPAVIPGFGGDLYTINYSQSGTVLNVLCRLRIIPPDEGGGPDPSFLFIDLQHEGQAAILHDGSSLDLTDVTYDTERAPADFSMDDFDGTDINGDWDLTVGNFSAVDGSLEEWTLTITIPDQPPGPPLFPTAPASVVVPTGIAFGGYLPPRKNIKSEYGIGNYFYVPFDCTLDGLKITAKNTGSVQNTVASVKRARSGIVTTIINQKLVLPTGQTFSNTKYANRETSERHLLQGDIIFVSLDQEATGIEDVRVEFVLNQR